MHNKLLAMQFQKKKKKNLDVKISFQERLSRMYPHVPFHHIASNICSPLPQKTSHPSNNITACFISILALSIPLSFPVETEQSLTSQPCRHYLNLPK